MILQSKLNSNIGKNNTIKQLMFNVVFYSKVEFHVIVGTLCVQCLLIRLDYQRSQYL